MLKTGLVSVTFRKLSPSSIIELVARAGLEGIEWGGDIHVPHGNTTIAKKVFKETKDAGIEIAAYGSYYKAGVSNPSEFEKVIASADALHAPIIRIWAGDRDSYKANPDYWEAVSSDIYRIADIAVKHNIFIALEFHKSSLTDSSSSTLKLLEMVRNPFVSSYWQPRIGAEFEENLKDIECIGHYISNIHVFHWLMYERRPLSEGELQWCNYLKKIPNNRYIRYCMLEFVMGDCPHQFIEDAEVLKRIVLSSRVKLDL